VAVRTGSAASGQRSVDSDLDLAVLDRQPIDPAQLYDLARTLEVTLGEDVDLVDLLTASTVLKKEVIAGGRVIHCADSDAVLDFEARSLSEYGRYREGMEPLLQAVRETGKAYAI
jgi:predicted nucleotidyltransferase